MSSSSSAPATAGSTTSTVGGSVARRRAGCTVTPKPRSGRTASSTSGTSMTSSQAWTSNNPTWSSEGARSMIGRIKTQTAETSQFLVDWMEHRTGIVTMLEHFLYEPVPKRGAWLYTLGSAVLFTITLQFLTGILLLFYYAPTTDDAWNSVDYIMTEAYFGQLIRRSEEHTSELQSRQ